jgi:hypothetical protein
METILYLSVTIALPLWHGYAKGSRKSIEHRLSTAQLPYWQIVDGDRISEREFLGSVGSPEEESVAG